MEGVWRTSEMKGKEERMERGEGKHYPRLNTPELNMSLLNGLGQAILFPSHH